MTDETLIERIIQAGLKKQLGRREFMHYATAAGLSLAGASSMWSSKVAAQTPKRGGKFRMGTHDGNTTDSLDPGVYLGNAEILVSHTHRSYLTEITAENGLGPDMANAWSATPDAKTWTFELSKDAVFQSGKKFTARDAVASLNHHRGEGTTSAAKPLLADITDIRSDGDHTVVIELSQGFADLPWVMTDYHLVMLPANEDGTIDWQSGDGAGPYKLVNHEPGVRHDFVRHDGWHREGAYFDEISVLVLNDPNARQSAIVTGDVDACTRLDPKTVGLLQRNEDIVVENVPSAQAVTMPMFCDTPPFDNVDVRLALKHAIDREEIIEKILYGGAVPGNDYHIAPTMPYYPDLEQRKYDPDKAKFHLKNAGMDSLKVQISASEGIHPGAVDMCVLFSESAKAANIDIDVVREPSDGYWSNVWLKKPFAFVTWGGRPTPDTIFTLAYKHDAAWNESRWQNERFNELLLLAKAELDDNLRSEMYREMAQLSHDDGGTIIPVYLNLTYARRKNVMRGASLSAAWTLDGERAGHRWWFV